MIYCQFLSEGFGVVYLEVLATSEVLTDPT